MSGSTHQRSLWQVLGLYAAGSWVVLQVIDVLTQNIDLPPWVFTLTLTLLLIGLPVTAATAYFQGIGRSSGAQNARGLFTWGNVMKGGVAALALWGIAVTGWMVLSARETEESEWDLVTGLDEIRRRVGEYDYPGANAHPHDGASRRHGLSSRLCGPGCRLGGTGPHARRGEAFPLRPLPRPVRARRSSAA
jgi:hypothetical protein